MLQRESNRCAPEQVNNRNNKFAFWNGGADKGSTLTILPVNLQPHHERCLRRYAKRGQRSGL